MALNFYWNCEQTDADFSADNAYDSPFTGTCYSIGDDTGTPVNSVEISATAARSGTYGILSNANTEHYTFSNNTPIIVDRLVGCVAFSIYMDVLPGFSADIGVRVLGADADDYLGTRIGSTGLLTFRINSNNGGTPAQADVVQVSDGMATDVWYGVVVRWDQPNSKRKIEIYNADGSLRYSLESTNAFTAPEALTGTAAIKFGNMGSIANTMYFDNYMVGSTYDEPLQNNLTISTYQDYDGSTGTTYLKLLTKAGAEAVDGPYADIHMTWAPE